MSIQHKINTLHWEKWLCREFSPFIASLFVGGHEEKICAKTGFKGFSVKAQLFQNGYWYESKEVWQDMVRLLTPILRKKSVFDLTQSLAKFKEKSKQTILRLVEKEQKSKTLTKEDILHDLQTVYQILTLNTSYIWLAHGLEEYYKIKLHEEVPRYVQRDIEKFIGDASFPIKKNAHSLMEEALRKAGSKTDLQNLAQQYGWLKARGFGQPFSIQEIEMMKKNLSNHEENIRVKIPSELKELFRQMQELVFYRTERTDIFYELLFLARPIFERTAKAYQIPFSEFPNYTIQSLISGKPIKLSKNPTMATFDEEYYLGDESLLEDEEVKKVEFVTGKIAQKGIVRGVVKIVKDSSELDKVQKGNILVTQMTFPAFIPAMVKARAFVTDEGGLTCHAAIVAREMRKPCIIGTKIATQVFKDGDVVEVDADKGVVKKV